MTALDRRPPAVLWLYFAATALAFGLSFAPSSVDTIYTPVGLLLWAALLIGLSLRLVIARRLLILFGVLTAIVGLDVQDQIAVVLSALELVKVCLLLTPAMRRYTDRGSESSPAAAGGFSVP